MLYIFIALSIVEAAVIAVLLFFKYRTGKEISEIAKYLGRLAKKQVDMKAIRLKSSDSKIRELAADLNLMRENYYGFIESTKGNIAVLSDSIDKLSGAAKINEEGNEQISNDLSSVAANADSQLGLVRDNLKLIESDHEMIGNIQHAMGRIKQILIESADCCKSGVTNMETYEKDMHFIETALKNSTDILQNFNEQIERINSIGGIIIEISDHLQLLSLNASIEAAKAGEHGKGFAIVAQEMNVMSEQTKENMKEINDILEDITKSSVMVTKSIQDCDNSFGKNASVFRAVSSSFRTINEKSQSINDNMQEIFRKFAMIAQNADSSYEKAENVLAASENITGGTADIVSVSERTAGESVEVRRNVEELEGMFKRLYSLIIQFNTGITPVEKTRAQKIKIAFFSKLDNYFWESLNRGVLYAKKELEDRNAEVTIFTYVTMEDEKQIPDDIKKCIDEKYDAIIVPGFLQGIDNDLKSTVKAGVKVFSYISDIASDIKRVSCYVADHEEAAIVAARAAAKTMNKKGKVVIVRGPQEVSGNKIKYEVFVNYIKKNYPGIQIADTIPLIEDGDAMYDKMVEYLKGHSDVDVVYCTSGKQLLIAKAIEDCGLTGKVKEVIFDPNELIYKYMKKGVIAAVVDHSPFLLGHDPVILMYNHLADNMPLDPAGIKCKVNLIDQDNYMDRVVY